MILTGLLPDGNPHTDWADWFYEAAHDPSISNGWDQDVFLAALLSLSWAMTRIMNIRGLTGHYDNIEWFPYRQPPSVTGVARIFQAAIGKLATQAVYQEAFANEMPKVESIGVAHTELGVGPMRLIERKIKERADDLMGSSGGATFSSDDVAKMGPAIDAYLKRKNSPMAGYGSVFVSGGQRNDLDPWLAVAIAGAETTWATNPNAAPRSTTGHNAWGYLSATYGSWEEGINGISDYLGQQYLDLGLTTTAKISGKWAPVGAANDPTHLNENWTANVNQFYRETGGNPDDVTLSGNQKAADKTPQTATSGHDQYEGGRWHPRYNIRAGAEKFRAALDAIHASPGDGDQIQAMVGAYVEYRGIDPEIHVAEVKNFRKFLTVDPNFMGLVKGITPALRVNADAQTDHHTEGTIGNKIMPQGWPTEEACIKAFSSGLWVAPPETSDLPLTLPIKFLQAKYYTASAMGAIKYIVVHTMEMAQTDQTAENCANYFAFNVDENHKSSAHYCIDSNTIMQCVHDSDEAWGVIGTDTQSGVSINTEALHFEHAGCAGTVPGIPASPTDWSNAYTQKMMALSAQLTAKKARQFGIPTVHLSVADIQSGQRGFVGHDDLNAAWHGGDHSDPGPNWPWATYMALVRAS
jgi:N-acetyl-anhydromuramyl-L-alanine amidase AmpD